MKNNVLKRYKEYLSNEDHQDFIKEAQKLSNNETEIVERFSSELKFGTSGVRGIIGAGSNRINPYTISLLSQALVNYIQTQQFDIKREKHAIIAYDSRRYSKFFAVTAASVFASNQVKTYLFENLNPVPLLGFAVRYYKCTFGVMITASHNPPEYNGYKIYWDDGTQIFSPHDAGIIKSLSEISEVKKNKVNNLMKQGLISLIHDDEIYSAYQKTIISPLLLRTDYIKKHHKSYPITYTPLHGTGLNIMQKLLKECNFSFTIVREQAQPDENFSSLRTLNPEDPFAFDQALILAKKQQAQLIIATDPDADRLGINVYHNRKFVHLNGNQIGILLFEYLISRHQEFKTMPQNPYCINTIVSSRLPHKIAQFYGLKSYQVLTGFKHIAEKMRILKRKYPQYSCIFAYEESHGFLASPYIHDKDAISSALLIAECGLWNYQQNLTLVDRLNKIYEKFGYFIEKQINKKFKCLQTIEILMDNLRSRSLVWCHSRIICTVDYLKVNSPYIGQWGQEIYTHSSNVLEFNLENNCTICVRPSGTEPKIKFYILGQGEDKKTVKFHVKKSMTDIENLISSLQGRRVER